MDKGKAKLSIIFTLSLIAILISVFVLAKPDTTPRQATNDKSGVSVIIPAHAVAVADDVFSLGTGVDVDGRAVQGFLFIDRKKANAKPVCGNGVCENGENAKKCPADCTNGGGNGGGGGNKCFAVFAKGAAWKTTESYITAADIDSAATAESLETWDSEISGFEIFGTEVAGTPNGSDDVSPDGRNEVEFENLGADGTIAFAIVWGIFRGPPSGRELVEWDVTFNSNFTFGDFDGTTTVMDYRNIATHEFGHALGLTHPDDTCTEETMYRFAAFNETKKRTLEAGDVAGVNELYT